MMPMTEGRNALEGIVTRVKRVVFLLKKDFRDNTNNGPQRKEISS